MESSVPTNTTKVKELASSLQFASDPEVIFEKVSRTLTEKPLEHMSYPETRDLALAAGVGNQFTIADAVDHQYSTLAVSFARQLIAEYECKTPSEIATAEVVAASYANYLEYSRLVKIYKRDATFHKAVDRAHRQYLSSLSALRQMKRPSLSVNVVAKNAFVAQNQVNKG